MIRYLFVGTINGIFFGILDGLINGNPYAQKLFEIYKPIAKTSINIPAGFTIDIAYGLIMGFLFILLFKSLPGKSGFVKGVVFGLIVWFFRVIMQAASTWMTLQVPATALLYSIFAGLIEMIIIGAVYGTFLKRQDT